MPNSVPYNSTDSSPLPLDSFFTALKHHDIGVTPAQIAAANKIIWEYAPKVSDDAALAQYLCPLFATNQAEQERFMQVFATHFLSNPETTEEAPIHPPKPPSRWKKTISYLVIILLMALLFTWWQCYKQKWWPYNKKKDPLVSVRLDIVNQNNESNDDLRFITKDTLFAKLVFDDTLLNQQTLLHPVYNWGDNTAPDTTGRHTYTRSGIYTVQASIKVSDNTNPFKKDTTFNDVIRICDFASSIQITAGADNDSIPVGKPMMLTATVAGNNAPDSLQWMVRSNNMDDSLGVLDTIGPYATSKQQKWEAHVEGTYSVYVTAIYDSINSPCSFTTQELLYTYDPNKPRVNAFLLPAPSAQLLKPQYGVKPYWYWIWGGGIVLLMILGNLCWKRYKKLSRAGQDVPLDEVAYQQLLRSFLSDQPSANVPFLNNNQLVPPGSEMAMIGRLMRRRIEGENLYLHIGKTISKAVRNSGLFQPVMAPRTRQSEYLLLIEESHINSQQTKLFEYLADTLHRHNVFIEKYYYRYEPSLCYNEATPQGITLEKLNQKYASHVLVIAGNGHQLVYPYQPMVSPAYQTMLNRWQHKAILTPIPYPDWEQAEKNILPTVIPVFPADVAGQLLMMQALADDRINVKQALQEELATWYATEAIDFETLDELLAYCENAEWAKSTDGNPYHNTLFQWIAALAVYPKLQWELTLAIGKAILEATGNGHELAYGNLLRLARMGWMKTGILPSALRLELLKQLTQTNEVLTRQTILAALAAIPASEVRPGHAAYEEKETQRIINEFNLYAYDPVTYASYASSKAIFESLWKNKKIMDAPIKKYLRNEEAQWPTLINNRMADSPDKANSIPLDNYFKPLPPIIKGLALLFRNLAYLSSILTGLFALGLITMIFLQLGNTNKWPFTRQKDVFRDITFTVQDSATDRREKDIFIRVDDSSASFTQTNRLRLLLSDSARTISIAVNGEPVFDTFMPIDRDRYDIVLNDKRKEIAPVLLTVVGASDCNTQFNDNGDIRKVIDNLNIDTCKNIRYVAINSNATGNCLTEIRMGRNMPPEASTAIINHFKNNGFALTLKAGGIKLTAPQSMPQRNQYGPPSFGFKMLRQSADDRTPTFSPLNGDTLYEPKDGEIIISGKTEQTIIAADNTLTQNNNQINRRPSVLIQLSTNTDKRLFASADRFRKELVSKGYTVDAFGMTDYKYNSGILYVDKEMATEARAIAKLYNRYYPNAPLQTQFIGASYGKPKDNRIIIWIKTIETPGANINVQQQEPTSKLGAAVLSIAERELGTKETPPGSGKTKYGEWSNPKLNAQGMSWSAAFVAWVYDQAGVPNSLDKESNGFSSFADLLQFAQYDKKMITQSPAPGDIFIIDKVGSAYNGGIFVKWIDKSKGTFATIEGNIALGKDKKGAVGRGTRSNQGTKVYFVHIKEEAQEASAQ